jgi:DNA-binding transcriptional LysR family regulator
MSTDEMLAGLREGKLDLAFVVRPPRAMLRGLRFEDLARDSSCIAMAPNHPLSVRASLTLEEIAREPLIAYSRKEYPEYHESLEGLFSKSKAKPRIAEEHDSVSSLIAAVEAGGGVALVAESLSCISGLRLKLLPISPPPAPLVIGVACGKGRATPAAEVFLNSARQAAKSSDRHAGENTAGAN